MHASIIPEARLQYSLAAIVLAATLLGGGGVAYGAFNLIVLLVTLFALALNRDAFFSFWGNAPLWTRILIAATIALPLIQLIPLPPPIWQGLPGRDLAVEAREIVNATGWHPASLDRGRTLVALSSLIVPLAVITLGWGASKDGLKKIAWLIVALGTVNFAVGIPQVLSQGQSAILYPENPMPGVLFGLFANRNTTGIFLALCLCLIAGSYLDMRAKKQFLASVLAFALIFTAILLTRSRSAMVLALIPAAIFAWRMVSATQALSLSRRTRIIAAVVIAALLAGFVATVPGSRLETSLDRFAQHEDPRSFIWPDAMQSAQRYWPIGAGVGTFDEVFQIDQSLENMGKRTAGRAHNDYIELAIESGAVGISVLVAWFALLNFHMWRSRHTKNAHLAWCGAAGLALIAGQSITDYPLRNMAMLAMAAFMLVLMLRFGNRKPRANQ